MFGLNTIIIIVLVIIIGAVAYWFFIRPRGKTLTDAQQQESILKKHIIEQASSSPQESAPVAENCNEKEVECSEISQAKKTTIRSLSKLKNPVDFMIEEEDEDVFTTEDLEADDAAAACAFASAMPASLVAFLNNVMGQECTTTECMIQEIPDEETPHSASPAPLVAEPESVSEPAPLEPEPAVAPTPVPAPVVETPAPVCPVIAAAPAVQTEDDSKKKVRIRRKK